MLYTILSHNCKILSKEKVKMFARPKTGDVFKIDKLVRVNNSMPVCFCKNDEKEFIISPIHFIKSEINLEEDFYSIFRIKNTTIREWKDKTIYHYEIEKVISDYIRVKPTSRL